MKKLFSTLLMLMLTMSLFLSVSCKNDKVEEEYENVKTELDKIKGIQNNSSDAIDQLKEEIKALEIEKQKLIAEKKRLEAEIIDLKVKDYEQENNIQDPGDKKQ